MVIVAGHIMVNPQEREEYLAGCMAVVEAARAANGCLDFAISADLVDSGRINILERWDSQEAVEAFRGNLTPATSRARPCSRRRSPEYDITAVRSLTGGEDA